MTSTNRMVTYLSELACMNAAADTERMAGTDSQFVPVDFTKRVIRNHTTDMANWRARGYRIFKGCQPVRTDYITDHADVFALFTDERQ